MDTRIVQIYSYKGGAGRTVSGINIASILAAEHQKRIVCIDMDLEGAGLAIVLGLHEKLANDHNRRCVQDIFGPEKIKSPEDFAKNWWPRIHFDVGKECRLSQLRDRLFVVPAAFAERSVDWTIDTEKCFKLFLYSIDTLVKPDYIFLDSASGLADWASLSLTFSDDLVAFFRWNKQFVEGTIRVVRFLESNRYEKERILLVPSAVPYIAGSSTRYAQLLEASRNRLKVETLAGKSKRILLLDGVREAVGLKWEERLLNVCPDLEDDEKMALEDFRSIANTIMQKTD